MVLIVSSETSASFPKFIRRIKKMETVDLNVFDELLKTAEIQLSPKDFLYFQTSLFTIILSNADQGLINKKTADIIIDKYSKIIGQLHTQKVTLKCV